MFSSPSSPSSASSSRSRGDFPSLFTGAGNASCSSRYLKQRTSTLSKNMQGIQPAPPSFLSSDSLTGQCARDRSWLQHEGLSIPHCPQHPHLPPGLQGVSPCQSYHQYRPTSGRRRKGRIGMLTLYQTPTWGHAMLHNSSTKCLPLKKSMLFHILVINWIPCQRLSFLGKPTLV